MLARFIVIAAATLVGTSAYAAEPAKPAPQPAAQTQAHTADVVLASAEQVQAVAPAEEQAVAPKPHRIARVTTCRCGGQQAQPDDQQ